MPRLVVTAQARIGIARCHAFLSGKSANAARRAAISIHRTLLQLQDAPEIGRPVAEEMRELLIGFGDSGYVALYRYESSSDTVYILAFRHQREAGY